MQRIPEHCVHPQKESHALIPASALCDPFPSPLCLSAIPSSPALAPFSCCSIGRSSTNRAANRLHEAGLAALRLDVYKPDGFDAKQTLPCRFWLCEKLRRLHRGLPRSRLFWTASLVLGTSALPTSRTSTPGFKSTMSVPPSTIDATKPINSQAILTAHSASRAAPTSRMPTTLLLTLLLPCLPLLKQYPPTRKKSTRRRGDDSR